MNRSILIIICDFMILSALSMSFGVAPANYSYTGSGTMIDDYTANMVITELKKEKDRLEKSQKQLLDAQQTLGYLKGREEQLKLVSAELNDARARLEILQSKMDKKDGEIGTLSKEQMHSQLEKEIQKRALLKVKLEEINTELNFFKNKYKTSVDDLSAMRKHLMTAQQELSEKNTKLTVTSQELEKTKNTLEEKNKDLTDTKNVLNKTSNDLVTTKQKLSTTGRELESAQVQSREAGMDLAFSKGKLSATEKELAETRSRLDRTMNTGVSRDLELAEATKKIADLKAVLRNAVGDLSKTKGELDSFKTSITETTEELNRAKGELTQIKSESQVAKTELKETRVRLTEAEEKLRSDALQKYAQSVVKLAFQIKEKRFLVDYENAETLFLPEVNIGGSSYIVADLKIITGMFRDISSHEKVYALSYRLALPEGDTARSVNLDGPLLSLNADNRVCLLEVPSICKSQVKIISYSQLRKRGLQNLHLFKYNSYGKGNCALESRCSMSFSSNDKYLYIRNSTRRTDSELKAQLGDFILTKEGELVGVVVAVEDFDLGRKQEAKCFIFPDNINLKDSVAIPILKQPKQEYFTSFSKTVDNMILKIKHLDSNYRDRK